MGFDIECVLNIQTLPGEYFCPVCRTLVYPDEAMQAACTHLYCKPCLAYIVATTTACPYDGYLVTQADSRPLKESNKPVADAIGKVEVNCLFSRSGCPWKGTFTECTVHCESCAFGNSPVLCNRCNAQILHRQVQDHAQACPGLQPQGQVASVPQSHAVSMQVVGQNPPAQVPADPSSAAQTSVVPVTSATAAAHSAAGAPAASSIPVPVSGVGTTAAPAQAPTTEQWYQQYQQFYQQYPGYNQYVQYQQYGQQAGYQQYAQPQVHPAGQQPVQGQVQPPASVPLQPLVQQGLSIPMQVQPHPQPFPQPQVYPQPQVQGGHHTPVQTQPQLQGAQVQIPPAHVQAQHLLAQSQPTAQMPTNIAGQQFGQPVAQPLPHAQAVPHQQLVPDQQPAQPLPQPQQLLPFPQQQPHQQYPLQPQSGAFPQVPHKQPNMPLLQAVPHPQIVTAPLVQPHGQQQPVPPQNLPHAGAALIAYTQQQPVNQMQQTLPPQRPSLPHTPNQGVHPRLQQPQQVGSQFGQHQLPAQGQFPQTMVPAHGSQGNIQPPNQQPNISGHHQHPVQKQPGVAPLQGYPPQLANAPSHLFPQTLQGIPPSAPPMLPQQPLRPQSTSYLHQKHPVQPYSQQNSLQGFPVNQAQGTDGVFTMPHKQFQHSSSSLKHTHIVNSSQQALVSLQDGKSDTGMKLEVRIEGDDVDSSMPKVPKVVDHTSTLTINGDAKQVKADVSQKEAPVSLEAAPKGSESNHEDAENAKIADVSGDLHVSEGTDKNMESKSEDVGDGENAAVPGVGRVHHVSMHPGQHDQHQPQNVHHGPGSGAVPNLLQERNPHAKALFGDPSNVSDPSQRPPGPDRMISAQPQHVPDGRFPEPVPLNMQSQRQEMVPYQMRPNLDPFHPPTGQHPFGPYPSDGRQGSFALHGQNPGSLPPVGSFRPPGEGMIRASMGMADSTRVPPFGPEDRIGPHRPINTFEAEANSVRYYDGRKQEAPPFAQTGEHAISHLAFPGRPNANARELEEDLKKFPRPAHLDEVPPPKFDNYTSSLRPSDRGHEQFASDAFRQTFEKAPMRIDPVQNSATGRAAFSAQSGGPFSDVAASEPKNFHEEFGRSGFPGGRPDPHMSLPDFNRYHIDGIHPLRSQASEILGFRRSEMSIQSRQEEFDGRERRFFGTKGLHLPPESTGNMFHDGRIPGRPLPGPDAFFKGMHEGQGIFHKGEGPSPGLMTGAFGSDYFRHGLPSEPGQFGPVPLHGEMDMFEHARRNPGSISFCRICRIDCDTLEGLDMHSHSKEHQKRALDIIESMKQDVTKKKKFSSEGRIGGPTRGGKSNRGNRH